MYLTIYECQMVILGEKKGNLGTTCLSQKLWVLIG